MFWWKVLVRKQKLWQEMERKETIFKTLMPTNPTEVGYKIKRRLRYYVGKSVIAFKLSLQAMKVFTFWNYHTESFFIS